MAALRFHLDESVNHAIANGLKRRGLDVTTTSDADLIAASDEDQLTYASSAERVLVTHDDDFLRLHAAGAPHRGIVFVRQRRRSIGQIVLGLAALSRRVGADEMIRQVHYL